MGQFLRSQEQKYTKISQHRNMILSSILTLLKNNLSHLKRFSLYYITAIENLRFEIYFRFSRIQTYRIFYFFRGLFGKHQTSSSQCWIFSSGSRWHKIRRLSISKFFVYCCHSNIDFTKTHISTNFNLQPIIVKILKRSDKEKTTFRAIEKYWYGL